MNKRDWYYKQIVTQAEMDEAFDWVEDADQYQNADLDLTGLFQSSAATEWDIQPTGPASMSVDMIGGPHVAYGKTGERINISTTTENLDCSVDEYGVSTAVASSGNSRWLSVFVRFKRNATDPEVDGNSVLVYTRQYEDAELFVRQGTEATTGIHTLPALLSDALLVCDIELTYAQTTIQSGHLNTDRKEWFSRVTGLSNFSDQEIKSIPDALSSIWAALDGVAGGGGVFSFTSTWFGGSAVTGAPANVSDALDAIVSDIALSTGAARMGTADVTTTYVTYSSQSVAGALSALATAIDGHIGGSAPYHPASSVTTTAISGSPESIGISEVQATLAALYGHVNDRPERTVDEPISGDWDFSGDPIFTGVPHMEAAEIGINHPLITGARSCINDYTSYRTGYAHPYAGMAHAVGTNLCRDLGAIQNLLNPGHYFVVSADETLGNIYLTDPITGATQTRAISGHATGGTIYVCGLCTDGIDIFLLLSKSTAFDSIIKVDSTNGNVLWETSMATPTTFSVNAAGNRVIPGVVRSSSPWTVDLYVIGAAMWPQMTNSVARFNSNTGAKDWDEKHTAVDFEGRIMNGGLAHDGTYIAFTASSDGGTKIAKIGLMAIADGATVTPTTEHNMADSGTSADDEAHDLCYDGRMFRWISRTGYLRYIQLVKTNYWPAAKYTGTGIDTESAGFGCCFDGRNFWTVVSEPTTNTKHIIKMPVNGNWGLPPLDVFFYALQDTTTISPISSNYDLGRMCKVGPHVCSLGIQPGNAANRNQIVTIYNSMLW